MKCFALAFAIAVSLSCTTASDAQALKIAAGSTATDLIVTPIKAPFEKATGIQLTSYKLAGKAAVAQLGKGDVQAVITDATLESITADIKKGAIAFADASKLKATPIMKTRSIVVVNKANPVSNLSKEQLKAIFSGKSIDWKDVGGNEAPVIVAISSNNKGTLAEFSRQIMNNEGFLKEPASVAGDQDVKEFVASSPEAIGVLPSMEMVDSSVKAANTPDISKTVSLFTIGEPSGDVKKLLDYLTGAGKSFIKK